MIEKHQILIDGLVKIVESKPIICKTMQEYNIRAQLTDKHYKTIASDTLKTYMGLNNIEADEGNFLPGYHEYITAHCYDIRQGYSMIEYSIPKNILNPSQAFILSHKHRLTHGITSIIDNETHLIIIIDIL